MPIRLSKRYVLYDSGRAGSFGWDALILQKEHIDQMFETLGSVIRELQ